MGWTVRDFWCAGCRLGFDELVQPPWPEFLACRECGEPAERVFSAPHPKRFVISVDRGKVDPAPHPAALNTQAIGDGMSHNEFHAMRKKQRADERRRRVRRMVS